MARVLVNLTPAVACWLAFGGLSGCHALPHRDRAPSIFAGATNVERVDFEKNPLNRPPAGFEARSGDWSVVDSPTALSGEQVLVRRGDEPAALLVQGAERAEQVAGEVALRVLMGASGAGLACETGEEGSGYLLKLEPSVGRAVLLRVSGDDTTAVGSHAVEVAKDDWTRVGLLCQSDRVIGYLAGKPFARDSGLPGVVSFGLYADGGTTVQFDDLRYWAKK